MADGAKKIYVQRVVVPPSPRAAADGADDDGDGDADLGGDAIAYARAAAAAAAAGWDARSDERLRQLESQLRDRPHATLLERLSIELPHMGRDACERRLDWLARRRRYVAARRALAAAWAAREGALAIEARAAILGQAEKEARAAEEKGAREARRAKAERLHGEVAGIQVERARRDAEAAAEASERERLEGLVAEAARRRHEAERAHKRALIAQYREERDEEEAREEARRAAGRAEEQRLEAERAAYNLQRVEFRQHQLDVKERVRREEAAAQRILDDLHRAAVERALEAAQPDVPDDPTRALRPTAASAAPAEKEAPLFKTTGYSEATLMKDMRFKLGAALSGAGLGRRRTRASCSRTPRSRPPCGGPTCRRTRSCLSRRGESRHYTFVPTCLLLRTESRCASRAARRWCALLRHQPPAPAAAARKLSIASVSPTDPGAYRRSIASKYARSRRLAKSTYQPARCSSRRAVQVDPGLGQEVRLHPATSIHRQAHLHDVDRGGSLPSSGRCGTTAAARGARLGRAAAR